MLCLNGSKHSSNLSVVGNYIIFAEALRTVLVSKDTYITRDFRGYVLLNGNGVIFKTYTFCQFNSGKDVNVKLTSFDVTYLDPNTVRNVYM